MITVFDRDARVIFYGPANERLTGRKAEERLGNDAFGIVHPDDVASVREVFGQILASPGASFTVTYRALHKDGSVMMLESVATNLLVDPSIRGIVVNTRDISERARCRSRRPICWKSRSRRKASRARSGPCWTRPAAIGRNRGHFRRANFARIYPLRIRKKYIIISQA
jgi:PAS domain S-box-containing protein